MFERQGTRWRIRDNELYEPVKQAAVRNLTELGERFSSPLKTLEEQHPEIYQTHQQVIEACRQQYDMDDLAIEALSDALFREAFNSKGYNRFHVPELRISQLKAKLTSKHLKDDSHASMGIGNIKAFRINHEVYMQLPAELQSKLEYDQTAQHVTSQSLAELVNSGDIQMDYRYTALVYGAVYAANKTKFDRPHVQAYEPWQKRYVASVLMCCTDPIEEDAIPQDVAYDNGFMLLRNPEFAYRHFERDERAIKERQHLADFFYTGNTLEMSEVET